MGYGLFLATSCFWCGFGKTDCMGGWLNRTTPEMYFQGPLYVCLYKGHIFTIGGVDSLENGPSKLFLNLPEN
jgi:hypothetical protein